MIFLSGLSKITEDKFRVGFVHYKPFHEKYGLGKTQEQLEREGVLVETIDAFENNQDGEASLYCNPSTKQAWYEYEDIPKTEEEQREKIQMLEQSIAELTMAVSMMMGGM